MYYVNYPKSLEGAPKSLIQLSYLAVVEALSSFLQSQTCGKKKLHTHCLYFMPYNPPRTLTGAAFFKVTINVQV